MGSGSNSSTQTTGMPPEYSAILQNLGNAASQAIQMPYQQYMGPRVANLSPLQQQSMGGYSGLLSDPSWNQAQSTYSNMQTGGMNPYLKDVEGVAIKDATDAYNNATMATLRRSNTPGNLNSARADMAQNMNDQALARGLTQGIAGIRANAFESSQNRALQGAQGAGNLAQLYSGILGNAAHAGDMQRGFDQQVIDTNYGDWQRANDYPWTQLQRGADLFGTLAGGAPRTTTTTGPGRDPVATGLGIWALGNQMGGSGSKK